VHVERRRLDDRFASARGKMLRVLAPGGYGKSSIVARWVSDDDRVVRWVDLEHIDNDPVAMVGALGRALDGLTDAPIGAVRGFPADPADLLAVVLPRLTAAIEECADGVILVLDDVHRVDDPTSLALLAGLAEHLGAESTLILCGRSHRPGEAIGRLRLRPGVVDVSTDDLALTCAETDELLRSMAVELCPDDLADLHERLDGWPAGVRLAGLVLGDGRDPQAMPLAQVDDATPIVDYLRAEWTGQLDPGDRDFLRAAACLDRFTGEMCDEVMERRGSADRLRHLHRDELLVIPLDRRDVWFRMHPLLARWMQNDLRSADPERWHRLHLRASSYWERAGDVDLAVQHAAIAGDLVRCEALVVEHGPRYLSGGLHVTVQQWLGKFPAEHVAGSAPLTLIAATEAFYHDVPRSVMWYRQLQRALDAGGALEDDPVHAAWADVLRAALEQAPATELIPVAERALDVLPPGPWRAFCCLVLGGLRIVIDDRAAAEVLDEGAFEAQLAGVPLLEANCLSASAILLELEGDHEAAAKRCGEAREIVRARRVETMPTTAPTLAMSSLVEARAGRRTSAVADLELARRNLEGFAEAAPWFNVITRLALIRACLRLDDRVASRELVRELERHLRFDRTGAGADRYLASMRLQVDATPEWGDTASSLTGAELRVLQYLPTNLSLADIAAELFVSRNTVKSHTAAIYRKLGTTSRNQAVELARAAGLLDEGRAPPPVS
jgi:LuxR family maltose regulon positive regulatory protein